MNIYIIARSYHGQVRIYRAHWLRSVAEEHMARIQEREAEEFTHARIPPEYQIFVVEIDPLTWLVNNYFQFRKYEEPTTTQAMLFLASETGELADCLVHGQADWVRNNPETKDAHAIRFEIADVLMMLTKFAGTLGYDPIHAMVEKMQSKGWKQ